MQTTNPRNSKLFLIFVIPINYILVKLSGFACNGAYCRTINNSHAQHIHLGHFGSPFRQSTRANILFLLFHLHSQNYVTAVRLHHSFIDCKMPFQLMLAKIIIIIIADEIPQTQTRAHNVHYYYSFVCEFNHQLNDMYR